MARILTNYQTSIVILLVLTSCGLVLQSTAFSCSIGNTSKSITRRPYTSSRVTPTSSTSTAITMMSSSGALSLRGKTALITGSSGGIGKAIASKFMALFLCSALLIFMLYDVQELTTLCSITETFAANGADVIVHYNNRREGAISTHKEINDYHSKNNHTGKCLGIVHADFRHPNEINDMFQYVINDILKDSRLDILVNNAGVVTKLALEDDDDNLSVWHETMSVNLHAPVQLMRMSHAHMKSTTRQNRKGGVIINNTSIHGSRSVEYMTAYAASKAALE